MTSYVSPEVAARLRALAQSWGLGQVKIVPYEPGQPSPDRATVTIKISASDRVHVRDLPELPDDEESRACLLRIAQRQRARMEDDMLAAAYGQPMRHEMKPARIVRVK